MQRMVELGAELGIVAEPWWVPVGDARELLEEIYRVVISNSRYLQVLVAGDFNARSPVWDPAGRSNARGGAIREWAARLGFHLLNSVGRPTCVRPQGSSVVDLAWVSPAARVRFTDWRIDEEECLSDHKLICMVVEHEAGGDQSLANQRAWGRRYPSWTRTNLDKEALGAYLVAADWAGGVGEWNDGIRGVEWLADTLKCASDASMSRRKKGVSVRRSVYWWTGEIAALRTAANAARKRWQRARERLSLEVVDHLNAARNDARKELKKAIKAAKNKAWEDLLQTIDRDPWGKPYRMVMGRLRPAAPPITSVLETGVLDGVLRELFPCPVTSLREEECWRSGNSDEFPVISREELQAAAKDMSLGKAPGLDGIIGGVVRAAVDVCGDLILKTMNELVREGCFPKVWKETRLVLVKKKVDAPENRGSFYRPICLVEEMGKLFERVLYKRLVKCLWGNDKLCGDQFGFRPGKSTLDAIDEVRSGVQMMTGGGRVVIIVSFDIQNSFNTLPWSRIRDAMRELGVPYYLFRVIIDYLSDSIRA
ncbi:hypothetical protein M0802_015573 [Mischocyttarus mexicanus]|nr:hypothetical protein M0802_015573 [Mischocyttarus mexicanus]